MSLFGTSALDERKKRIYGEYDSRVRKLKKFIKKHPVGSEVSIGQTTATIIEYSPGWPEFISSYISIPAREEEIHVVSTAKDGNISKNCFTLKELKMLMKSKPDKLHLRFTSDLMDQLSDFAGTVDFEQIQSGAINPDFVSRQEKVHNWRNYIPECVKDLWNTFNFQSRIMMVIMAKKQANEEEWE